MAAGMRSEMYLILCVVHCVWTFLRKKVVGHKITDDPVDENIL
jgi:hypothetical protein